MGRPSKAAPAASASLELPARPGQRLPALLAAIALLGIAAFALLLYRASNRRDPPIELTPVPPSWVEGLVLIPNSLPMPPPPPPEDPLEARLSALARQVERARETVEPPLVAFGSESLHADIEHIIAGIENRAQVSVHIRDLDSGRVLFDHFDDTLLNPASNQKLLTVAAALDLLGPEYVFETRVLLADGVLYLVGEGDPMIDGEALAALAAQVAENVPVGEVSRIVVDDSAFSPRAFGPGFSPEGWGPSYEAPSGAMSLNFNTVEITVYPVSGMSKPAIKIEPDSTHVVVDNQARRVGSGSSQLDIRSQAEAETETEAGAEELPREAVRTKIVIHGTLAAKSRGYKVRRRVVDPGMYAGGAFALMLAEASHSERLPVSIGQAPRVDLDRLDEGAGDGDLELPQLLDHDDEHDVSLVGLRRSAPLIDIVGELLTYSNNFMAEQVIRTLGWRMTGEPGDWDNGGEVVRSYWETLGNAPDDLVFENGSGLSRVNRVTTSGLVDLMAMATRTQAGGSSLFDLLPVAGVEGTLRTRLRRSGKRVRAKTGTLDGVSGLTGFITSEAGAPQVAFSILINVNEDGMPLVANVRRGVEDAIVMAVLEHIDGWEATRGEIILDLEPLAITPGFDPDEDGDQDGTGDETGGEADASAVSPG